MKDFEIRCDKSHLERNNSIYAKFTLGPFLPGQGTTFGNALRRSLLAELSGLAITAFEIIGVMQEFSTLAGLRESILDLSLNLKQIVLTGVLPYSIPPVGFLNVRGPAIVKASDLKLPAGVYCTSPNQYIATLGSSGVLNIKFLVSVGKGYSIQPYSLYRSLSKIKLQPTFNFENNDVSSLFEQSFSNPFTLDDRQAKKKWSNEEDSQSIFHSKGIENRIFANPLDKLQVQNQFESEKTFKAELTNSHSLFSSISQKEVRGVSINKKVASSFTGKDESYTTSNKIDTVDSSFSNFINTSTTENSSGYAHVQTQIFQRINPHQVLPIDAVFTPVSRVNFLIQINDRFETPRENIILEIWTNGSLHPKRALEEATLSLVQNFDTLLKKIQQASSYSKGLRYWTFLQPLTQSYSPTNEKNNLKSKKKSITNEIGDFGISQKQILDTTPSNTFQKTFWDENRAIYNLDIGNLNLSLQTFILLKKAKIHTLSQLLTLFSFQNDKFVINSTQVQMEKTLFLNEKTIKELNSVVSHLC